MTLIVHVTVSPGAGLADETDFVTAKSYGKTETVALEVRVAVTPIISVVPVVPERSVVVAVSVMLAAAAALEKTCS